MPLEKYYQFARYLRKALPKENERLPVDILENIDMDSYRIQETSSGKVMINADGTLKQAGMGHSTRTPRKAPLSEIIHYTNENFGTDFTDEDKLSYFADDMEKRLIGNPVLRQTFNPEINSQENIQIAFGNFFEDTLVEMLSRTRRSSKRSTMMMRSPRSSRIICSRGSIPRL